MSSRRSVRHNGFIIKMLKEQEIIEYKNLLERKYNISLTYEEAKSQAEKLLQLYLVVYSKNLLENKKL